MNDEGYVKFHSQRNEKNAISYSQMADLNRWRTKMHDLKMIGAYDNGIGFGNISVKTNSNPINFIISGTQTGESRILKKEQYVLVTEYDFAANFVKCSGMTDASSESMTHASVYESQKDVSAVIHVHHFGLWKKLLYEVPTTEKVPYGTPEMAQEVQRLFREGDTSKKKIIVMAGHEEGIITFGKDLDEAGNTILDFYDKYCRK